MEKFIKIGKISEEAKETINAEGHTVLPGCIDTQTHFREPGSTDTEDLHSGVERQLLEGLLVYLKCLIQIHPHLT
jgi:dihydroorotase